jgi:hypothetical protein
MFLIRTCHPSTWFLLVNRTSQSLTGHAIHLRDLCLHTGHPIHLHDLCL